MGLARVAAKLDFVAAVKFDPRKGQRKTNIEISRGAIDAIDHYYS